MKTYYLTKANRLVYAERKPVKRAGKLRVNCFYHGTDGRAGWLVVERLIPVVVQ